MAHYAFLDQNNVVTEVIAGKEEGEDGIDWEQRYGEFRGQVCKRTSYNTKAGVHCGGGVPFRKNYAGIGYIYREDLDAFVPPKPFNSWMLHEESATWVAPVPMPQDKFHYWDEQSLSWVLDNTGE